MIVLPIVISKSKWTFWYLYQNEYWNETLTLIIFAPHDDTIRHTALSYDTTPHSTPLLSYDATPWHSITSLKPIQHCIRPYLLTKRCMMWYDRNYVKRLLSMETMRNSLQNHEYRSMAAFEKDFYELLNNGRFVTMEGSQVRVKSLSIRGVWYLCKGGFLFPQGWIVTREVLFIYHLPVILILILIFIFVPLPVLPFPFLPCSFNTTLPCPSLPFPFLSFLVLLTQLSSARCRLGLIPVLLQISSKFWKNVPRVHLKNST